MQFNKQQQQHQKKEPLDDDTKFKSEINGATTNKHSPGNDTLHTLFEGNFLSLMGGGRQSQQSFVLCKLCTYKKTTQIHHQLLLCISSLQLSSSILIEDRKEGMNESAARIGLVWPLLAFHIVPSQLPIISLKQTSSCAWAGEKEGATQ